MFATFDSAESFARFISENRAVLAYFSTEECNVCQTLKPKVAALIHESFPEIKLAFAEINHLPEVAAGFRIFAAPTLIVFFDGREFVRKSRNFGIGELKNEIERPYSLLFS